MSVLFIEASTFLSIIWFTAAADPAHKPIPSSEPNIKDTEEINKIIKKLDIIKSNLTGPDIGVLLDKLNKNPENINIIIEIADKYFSMQEYEKSFDLLIANYSKNKNKVKEKMVQFFEVLGNTNEYTITYRKKLSQLMFA